MSGAARLRELIERRETVIAPGAHDALGTRLVQAARFEACYMTGNGAVASMLVVPDLGPASFFEMLTSHQDLARIGREVSCPLFYDLLELDPGFVPAIAELKRHNFRIVVNCLTATRIDAAAVL